MATHCVEMKREGQKGQEEKDVVGCERTCSLTRDVTAVCQGVFGGRVTAVGAGIRCERGY